jgi:hypothetical protein
MLITYPPSSAKVKNEQSYTSTPPYAFMECAGTMCSNVSAIFTDWWELSLNGCSTTDISKNNHDCVKSTIAEHKVNKETACRHSTLNTNNQIQDSVKIYYMHTETHLTVYVRIIGKLFKCFILYKHFMHNFITFGIPWCPDDDL